jgi:hypothetical protein
MTKPYSPLCVPGAEYNPEGQPRAPGVDTDTKQNLDAELIAAMSPNSSQCDESEVMPNTPGQTTVRRNNAQPSEDSAKPLAANCDEVIERLRSDRSDYKVRLEAAALIAELLERLKAWEFEPNERKLKKDVHDAAALIATLQDEVEFWKGLADHNKEAAEQAEAEIARLRGSLTELYNMVDTFSPDLCPQSLERARAELIEARNKRERNARIQTRYDELMDEGKHGHYETMFRVVREELAELKAENTRLQEALEKIVNAPDDWAKGIARAALGEKP